MALDGTEQIYLERQVTVGRAILAALSLMALLETSGPSLRAASVIFLASYLLLALASVVADRFASGARFRIPLVLDFTVLAAFLYLTPSVSSFWFLFLFAVFALANRGSEKATLALVFAATAGIIFRVALADLFRWRSVWHWLAIGLGTIVSGLGMGFLGAREREHLARQQFLERITGHLRFDRGLTESIRQSLGELMAEFECEQACLAFRDDELERLFVWRVRQSDTEAKGPEVFSLARCETFLIDSLEVSFAWNYRNNSGEGFGWDRRTGKPFRALPPPPDSTQQEFSARSLLAVTLDFEGRPAGRMILVNPCGTAAAANTDKSRRKFSQSELRWLEQIVRHIGPPLENVFLMRSLRARAIESERSRISRDLHDGILQTLLSLNIQLDVLRTRLPREPEKAGQKLANLQKIVQQESEELRRMVTDLRPVRVESADMRELMLGFAERFRMRIRLGRRSIHRGPQSAASRPHLPRIIPDIS